jgi:hypothetical protein
MRDVHVFIHFQTPAKKGQIAAARKQLEKEIGALRNPTGQSREIVRATRQCGLFLGGGEDLRDFLAVVIGGDANAAQAMASHIRSGIRDWTRGIPAEANGKGKIKEKMAGRTRS